MGAIHSPLVTSWQKAGHATAQRWLLPASVMHDVSSAGLTDMQSGVGEGAHLAASAACTAHRGRNPAPAGHRLAAGPTCPTARSPARNSHQQSQKSGGARVCDSISKKHGHTKGLRLHSGRTGVSSHRTRRGAWRVSCPTRQENDRQDVRAGQQATAEAAAFCAKSAPLWRPPPWGAARLRWCAAGAPPPA